MPVTGIGTPAVPGGANESTLSLTFTDLMNEVSMFLGWGADYTAIAAARQTQLANYVNRGYRKFLAAYEWSFTRPQATRIYTTGTGATGGTVGNEITLPAGFGGGACSLQLDDHWVPREVQMTGQAEILRLRQSDSDRTDRPYKAAVVHDLIDPGSDLRSAGQRWLLWVWPDPDQEYAMDFSYAAFVGKLDATNKYPVGGMIHNETILAAALAAAELAADDTLGNNRQEYERLLQDSIRYDQINFGAENYGYNSDRGVQDHHDRALGSIHHYARPSVR